MNINLPLIFMASKKKGHKCVVYAALVWGISRGSKGRERNIWWQDLFPTYFLWFVRVRTSSKDYGNRTHLTFGGTKYTKYSKITSAKKEYLQKYLHNMNRVPRLLFANSFDYSNSKKILYKFRLSRIIMNNPNQLIASNPNSQLIDNSIFSNHSRIFKFLMMKQ